jgi:hypothetical protein
MQVPRLDLRMQSQTLANFYNRYTILEPIIGLTAILQTSPFLGAAIQGLTAFPKFVCTGRWFSRRPVHAPRTSNKKKAFGLFVIRIQMLSYCPYGWSLSPRQPMKSGDALRLTRRCSGSGNYLRGIGYIQNVRAWTGSASTWQLGE